MKIGYFQYDPRFGEVEANRSRIVEAMLQSDAELLVAPELATSGYNFLNTAQVERMAEPIPGPTTDTRAGEEENIGSRMLTVTTCLRPLPGSGPISPSVSGTPSCPLSRARASVCRSR